MQELAECETRELLSGRYQDLLDQHLSQLSELGKKYGLDAAELRISELTKACVAAREELHRHEKEHACCSTQVEAHV